MVKSWCITTTRRLYPNNDVRQKDSKVLCIAASFRLTCWHTQTAYYYLHCGGQTKYQPTQNTQKGLSMKTTLIALATLLMIASHAESQEGGRGAFNPEQMIERMFENDKNSDGKLSKDEVSGRMSVFFERLDANEDGFVTKDEAQSMMSAGGGGRGGQGGGPGSRGGQGGGPEGGPGGRGGQGGGPGGRGGQGGGPGGRGGPEGGRGGRGGQGGGPGEPGGRGGRGPAQLMAMMPIIIVLDLDKNGEISAEEIKVAAKSLKKLDKNQDGKISIDEMTPDFSQMMGGRGGPGGRGGQGGGPEGGRGGPGGRGGQGGGPGGRDGGSRPKRPEFGDDGNQ